MGKSYEDFIKENQKFIQRYFLVPTKYGGLMTIEKENIIYTDIFSSIKENLN